MIGITSGTNKMTRGMTSLIIQFFKKYFLFLFLLTPLNGMISCNIFSPVDPPAGDAQLLSAARSCFNQGNFDCAKKYYGQLSSNQSDEGNTEETLAVLAQLGLTADAFFSAIADHSGNFGSIIIPLINSFGSNVGQSVRLKIFQAYQNHTAIIDTQLSALVRFMTSIGLLAELFAEDASIPGNFQLTDFVLSPTRCAAATLNILDISSLSNCAKPSGKKIIDGTNLTLATATSVTMSGNPTLYMINAALLEIYNSSTQIGASGSFGSSSVSQTNTILQKASGTNGLPSAIGTGTDSPLYRQILIVDLFGASS
jgi:hypothetical protein